jgi:hypothetical protein
MFAVLDFRATYEPGRNELKVRAKLAPELLPVSGDGTSSPMSVHPTGQKSKIYPQVEGRLLRLSGRHARVRRDGYRKKFGEPNRIVVHDSGRLYPEAIISTTTAPQEVKNR